MAKDTLIYRLCPACDGEGIVSIPSPTPPHVPENKKCPECLGPNVKHPQAGGIYWGWIEKSENVN